MKMKRWPDDRSDCESNPGSFGLKARLIKTTIIINGQLKSLIILKPRKLTFIAYFFFFCRWCLFYEPKTFA